MNKGRVISPQFNINTVVLLCVHLCERNVSATGILNLYQLVAAWPLHQNMGKLLNHIEPVQISLTKMFKKNISAYWRSVGVYMADSYLNIFRTEIPSVYMSKIKHNLETVNLLWRLTFQ